MLKSKNICDEKFTSKYELNSDTYQGRKNTGTELTDDNLFQDVIIFKNDDDLYESNGRLGIDKCIDQCSGKCIEFGITGVGYCFPK